MSSSCCPRENSRRGHEVPRSRPSGRGRVAIGRAATLGVADAWVDPMIPEKLDLVGCGAVERLLPGLDGEVRYRIEAEPPLRMREVDAGHGNDIAHHNEPLSARHLEGN